MEFSHVPVLFGETIESLHIRPDGVYVDCTAGGGGHSSAILERLSPEGRLIAIDRDPDAIANLQTKFADAPNVLLVHDNYADIQTILYKANVSGADGILADLGVSSYQLDTPERGFSFHLEAPLDMRMSKEGKSAYDVVNGYPEGELRRILYAYGEEKFAANIAKNICEARKTKPIDTTGELVEIIDSSIPYKFKQNGHPAKKSFQAIRIEVNEELDGLKTAVEDMVKGLKKGGRIAIITFHSLEDRIVKQTFKDLETDCVCDKRLPICVCGKKRIVKVLTKKPIEASEEELNENPRAKSAKLRVAEKI